MPAHCAPGAPIVSGDKRRALGAVVAAGGLATAEVLAAGADEAAATATNALSVGDQDSVRLSSSLSDLLCVCKRRLTVVRSALASLAGGRTPLLLAVFGARLAPHPPVRK